jgi:vancomycin resistance protein VanW
MSRLFWARAAYHRVRRYADWWLHPLPWATARGSEVDFPALAARRTSPLKRAPDGAIAACTAEKTVNLRLGCARVDGLLIGPDEVFSFSRRIGPTTRRRGYLPALEMHDGQIKPEVGGGLCQLANLLLLLAIDVNAEIVERHRHSYDLFRDAGRTVPFGCGATVFYNYVDFQFRNTLAVPLLLRASVEEPLLVAALHAPAPLPFRVRIAETDHHFFRRDGAIYRANRVWRDVERVADGHVERTLLFENCCRVRYAADDLVEEDVDA